MNEEQFTQELETLKAEIELNRTLAIQSQQNHSISLESFDSALARITKLVDFVTSAEGSKEPD